MTQREDTVSTRDLASQPRPDEADESRLDGDAATDEPRHDEDTVATDEPRHDEDTVATDEPRHDEDTVATDEDTALLPDDQGTEFQGRWEAVQVTFVDDPREAVSNADALVAELMQQLADGFAQERERLEGQWGRGEDVSTEDLRVVLQRYRSFFRRLLSA
jgi:hypothetical protein